MKEIFASGSYGLVGLLFFFAFFTFVLFRTLRPSAKKEYQDDGNIPFRENEE